MVDKPLPALPNPALTTLSVEARNHRARLIQHFFSDIHEPRIENRRDGWLDALEKALDDLSRHISSGDWLSSIRRASSSQLATKEEHNEGQRDKALPESPDEPLKKLRLLSTRSVPPPAESWEGHLVICVSPHRDVPILTEDSDFDIIPTNIDCIFSGGSFPLQPGDPVSAIMYGLDGLREFNVEESNVRLAGGTFSFQGVDSPVQHMLLTKVLRLSVYVHLSLLLEQYFLSDSRVPITFPKSVPTHSPSAPVKLPPPEMKSKPRNSIFPSGFINGLLKRSSSILRTNNSGTISETHVEATPRKSFDGRLRRFSFINERRLSIRRHAQNPPQHATQKPFEAVLHRVEESAHFLSTSTGVMFKLPKILVDLAEREKATQSRLLMADERMALSSLLGWDGKDAEWRGMSGILGFVRYQQLSVLYSQHIPPLPPESSSASTISSHTSSNLLATGLSLCGTPSWTTYCYYSSGDRLLGDMINDLAKNANLPCDRPGCSFTRGQHEIRIIHGGIRIVIRTISDLENSADNLIQMWQSCAICEARTPRTNMHDGTFLFSFAKFLELLVYSPKIGTLNSFLCDHTTPPPGISLDISISRLNIVRHFSTASCDVSFTSSTIEDVFELKVPRLQIARGIEKASVPLALSGHDEGMAGEDSQKKELRKEIKRWWEGVADHIDKIEKVLERGDTVLTQKTLPRLPSSDDAYDVFHPSTPPGPHTSQELPTPPYASPYEPTDDNTEEAISTLVMTTPSEFSAVAPFTSSPESMSKTSSVHTPSTISAISTSTILPAIPSTVDVDASASQPPIPLKDNSEKLLMALRHNFHQIEQSLYSQLAKAPEDSLNEIRSTFLSTGRGTQKRLNAWQKKHLGPKAKLVGELVAEEPAWWGKECHVVPGGNIIVREDDWGSIIAHTLSTPDYHLELLKFQTTRSSSGSRPSTPLTSAPEDTPPSSFFSVATGYKLFSSESRNQPDPDQEGVVWNEPEQYSSVISRKESSRDHASRLGMRDILRRTSLSGTSSTGISTTMTRRASNSSAHSTQIVFAKAKADVVMTAEAANGVVNGLDALDAADLLVLRELSSVNVSQPPPVVKSVTTSAIKAAHPDTHLQIEGDKISSVTSVESGDEKSDETAQQDEGQDVVTPTKSSPPPLPPKVFVHLKEKGANLSSPTRAPETVPATATSSSFTTALANGINSAVRFVTNAEPSGMTSPSPSNAKHALLLADITNIDERPHIKYDWTIGKRFKFSCTVYYARQFDALRRRCGVNDLFLKSLSRSVNWTAKGGKSKSNFWKTSDERFIIKSLVDAWNVADLQVLIELAPSYFRYMDATAGKATVLAKLVGFYTIEIKNLETGVIQSKADLLVMENLFYDRTISKTFDLKGIQGRKVKAHGNTSSTLFDGEWIEGQQRTPMLVQPHSRIILRDAIKNDAEFLSKSNIMDYSLLLGVDEEKRQIACGLVDTIGSYTFAKTLEYKAKQGLQSGSKEVTVVPPAEYRDRFVNALEGYFIACPDKWSKPLDEAKIISDPNLLPSVL